MSSSKDAFFEAIVSARREFLHHPDASQLNERILQTFLNMGSETEDNLNCVEHIVYGMYDLLPPVRGVDEQDAHPRQLFGFYIKNTNISLSELLNYLENIDIPEEVASEFPTLTTQQWDAALRMVMMVFSAFNQMKYLKD